MIEMTDHKLLETSAIQNPVYYHPYKFKLPTKFKALQTPMVQRDVEELAAEIQKQASQHGPLDNLRPAISRPKLSNEPSREDLFKYQDKAILKEFKTDSIHLFFMQDKNIRFIFRGRDTQTSQNEIRIFEFVNGRIKQMHKMPNLGNLLMCQNMLYYFNKVGKEHLDFVQFDVEALKEVGKPKRYDINPSI